MVPNDENAKLSVGHPKVDSVWESRQNAATNRPSHDGVALWALGDSPNGLIKLVEEVRAKPRNSRIIEPGRFDQFVIRGGMVHYSHPSDFRALAIASEWETA